MEQLSMRLKRLSSAPPDVVYDFLADRETHLTWAGTQQTSDFRLLSLEAPAGPASVGTTPTMEVVFANNQIGRKLGDVSIRQPNGGFHQLSGGGLRGSPFTVTRRPQI
jgi:hypothetical protein